MLPRRLAPITLTTDASGNATVQSAAFSGRVLAIRVTRGTLTSGAVDITITVNGTAQPVLTITNLAADTWYYPRVPIQDEAGANALFAAGGTSLREPVVVANDTLKFVVAQGGNVLTGTADVIYG
jgi:hypothetical protein